MTPELRAKVIESRRAAGLPDHVEDLGVLAKVAAALTEVEVEVEAVSPDAERVA